ncbi:cytochrome c biogenesis protein CcdA [Kineococcus xinjiangensis]|uniref:Cytochrome c biogenesis protein CcdA n=1 Tax=Kineococcus xinjiangensis TaxID=512762 RepID=A0A2S6IKD1_9ACTN|nr:cytochrome c biogenesis CcdA family protein [Kineococcus xinjiangensis]PPK94635.1 cytochrome c biogenesis protein CcdA [Kineococcus xinjiangensis]
MTGTLAFAYGAGTLAALNPCGFALLPAYLALFVTGDGAAQGRGRALQRALTATAAMTAGFVAVFGVFGLLLAPLASAIHRWLPVVTVGIGLALLALGVAMLLGRSISLPLPKLRSGGNPTRSPAAMAFYGVAYAVASLGCTIGPFLAVTATTFRTGDTLTGLAAYGAYALGMGTVVGVLAAGVALARSSATAWLRRVQRHLTRAGGALLVVVGGYVAWYGWYEIRLARGGGSDPVVEAAATLQAGLVRTVSSVAPLLVVLAAVVLLLALVLAARRRVRS